MTKWVADAAPTKAFFIDMLTRDISIEECLFDLLDNSIDGAAKSSASLGASSYSGYFADISVADGTLSIVDNCGGIALDDAINYAFHFGRRADTPPDVGTAIGLYGIGMKRALFKMGRKITIQSATEYHADQAFEVNIDVKEWAESDKWEFPLIPWRADGYVGTKIIISELRDGVRAELENPLFMSALRRNIGTYYSFLMHQGFQLKVNGEPVPAHSFGLKSGEGIQPFSVSYTDNETGVKVSIKAGLAGSPAHDTDNPEQQKPDLENRGWFVVCNNRVVLAGDKSKDTVWGDSSFPAWHPQYSGFMGVVIFTSEDASALPWTTTKRDIDTSSPLYRRAVVKMKDATRPYLSYTNIRKNSLDEARSAEDNARLVPLNDLEPNRAMELPRLSTTRTVLSTISYQRRKSDIDRVAQALGMRGASNRVVGEKTFDYFMENELGE